MKHQNGTPKLNMCEDHRRSVIRNQIISFVNNGVLQTTTARAKEIKRRVERLITIAREGSDFNIIRRITKELPYDKLAVKKLIMDIAPRYTERPGGYTRLYSLGKRMSDTAPISRLEWV